MTETVIKVGGSLGQDRRLSDLMQRLGELGRRHRILVVPGGGAFADAIRDYDRRFGLDADACHWMAILAMDQYGHLISSLIPESEPVQSLAKARDVAAIGRVPVLLTYSLVRQTDRLPRTWDVTSDSIAAWVAGQAGAQRLILLKSVDGPFRQEADPPDGAGVPGETALVDPYLASILEQVRLEVWVVNGKYPERLTQLLETGDTKGTCLWRSDASAHPPGGDRACR